MNTKAEATEGLQNSDEQGHPPESQETFNKPIDSLLFELNDIWDSYTKAPPESMEEVKRKAEEFLNSLEGQLSSEQLGTLQSKLSAANSLGSDDLGIAETIIGIRNFLEEIQQTESPAFEISPSDKSSLIWEKLHKATSLGNELIHKGNKLFNESVDKAADALNKAVPGAMQVVTTFLPAQKITDSLIENVTKGATFLGKGFIKGTKEVFLFGLPRWNEALRIKSATDGATAELSGLQDTSEFAQIVILEKSEIQNALKEYAALREERNKLAENPTENLERLKEISEQLAYFEMKYQDTLDFTALSTTLEKGPKHFFERNEAYARDKARQLAESLMTKVTEYRKSELGKLADSIDYQGPLFTLASKEENREQLIEYITQEFLQVLNETYGNEQMQAAIKKVQKRLTREFGFNREVTSGAVASILRLIPIPEAPTEGYNSFWQEMAQSFKEGWQKPRVEFNWENIKENLQKINPAEWYENGMDWFPSFDEWVAFWKDMANKSAGECAEFTASITKDKILEMQQWLIDNATAAKEEALYHLQKMVQKSFTHPLKDMANKLNPFALFD